MSQGAQGSKRRTPKPTRLGWMPLLAAPVLGVLSVMTVDSWLLLLAGASLGLGIAAILLRPRLSDLDVTVTMPARAELGQPVTTRLVIRNTGRRATPLTRLTHQVAGLSDVTVLVDTLPRGALADVTVERFAVARGRTRSSLVLLSSSAPLGLVTTDARAELATLMTVHPALLPVRLPPDRSGGTESTQAAPDRSGVDVHGIREWRTGDEARQVHWRSTARRGRLVVLEREAPRGGTVTMLVAGLAAHAGWEGLVTLVASTGVAALETGRPVTLLADQEGQSQHSQHSQLSTTHRLDLLDWCAGLDTTQLPGRPLVEAALAAVGRGGTLHVATTEASPTWWATIRSLADGAGVELVGLTASPGSPGSPR